MNRLSIWLVITFWSLSMSAVSYTKAFADPNQQQIISSFKKKVEEIKHFFRTEPKILGMQSAAGYSPSGRIYYYSKYILDGLSYDIQRTNSLVSPFTAYVDVSHTDMKTTLCGDVEMALQNRFFSSLEKARENRDNSSCYEPRIDRLVTVRFYYAYQDQKWVFKEVSEQGSFVSSISAVLNKKHHHAARHTFDDNDPWRKLVE